MQRALLTGLVVLTIAACDDQPSRALPAPIPAPTGTTSNPKPDPTDPTDPEDAGGTTDSGTEPPEPGGWGDPTTTRRKGILRLAQLNVRNFFDTKCDSGNCTGDYELVPTRAQFDARAAQLATGLAALQADVITLEEVENQTCLDAVATKLEEAGFPYPVHYVAETGGTVSVDVALLARGELGTIKKYRSKPITTPAGTFYFTREFPEIHLTLGASTAIVFPAHFKSKASPDDPDRRFAEAKGAHDILVTTAAANPTSLVLLGGDLNDSPGSLPMKALEDDGKLTRAAKDIPLDSQGTFTFQGTRQAIDHLFVVGASAYVAKSTTVVRDTGKNGFAGSDHASIWADFNLPK